MPDLATIRSWEQAEIERSHVEAAHIPEARLRPDEANLRRYLDPPSATPYPLEYAFHLLGDVRGKRVLDLGCGDGENLVPLVRRGASVVGLEISDDLIALAERRLELAGLAGRVEFLTSSAHQIALPDQSVDVVLGIAILHHLDLARVAAEIRRVLRPGGRAIFQEPVRDSRLLKAIRRMIPYRSEDVSDYERPLTTAEIRELSSGFIPGRSRVFSLPLVNVANVVPALRRHILRAYRIDGALLRGFPFLQRWAGTHVFEITRA